MVTSHGYNLARIRTVMRWSCVLSKTVFISAALLAILNILNVDFLVDWSGTGMSLQTAFYLCSITFIICNRKYIGKDRIVDSFAYCVLFMLGISFLPGVAAEIDFALGETRFSSGTNTRVAIFSLMCVMLIRNKKYTWLVKPFIIIGMSLPTAALMGHLWSVNLYGAMSVTSAFAILFVGIAVMLRSSLKKELRYLVLNDSSFKRYVTITAVSFGFVIVLFPLINEADFIPIHDKNYITTALIVWFYQAAITWYAQNESKASDKLIRTGLKLKEKAHYDKLTGIYNRTAFTDLRNDGKFDAATHLIIFDIDRFKLVNDNYGHDVGDVILKSVSKAVEKNTRLRSDSFIRWGGEEFLIILDDIKEDQQALLIAESLRRAIETADYGDYPRVTSSFGLAKIFHGDLDKAIIEADKRLYRAKRQGRNRVECIFREQHTELYAQMIVDANTHLPTGIELLGRPPEELSYVDVEKYFADMDIMDLVEWTNYQIDVAEEFYQKTGLIANVNVDADILPLLDWDSMKNYHVGFEFTKIRGIPNGGVLEQIKHQNPNIIMILDDFDFKMGFKEHDLHMQHFDVIKLDQSLFKDEKTVVQNRETLKMTVKMARVAHCKVVAEGIAEAFQLEAALDLEINSMQGFMFSVPDKFAKIERAIVRQYVTKHDEYNR